MSINQIFILIVDISGYTNFIRLHKVSLLHAERIIGDLMESILKQVEAPVIAHEILGDAISLYAHDDGSPDMADNILIQLERYFDAFRAREAYLLRECQLCVCEACTNVGKLKLKAILHSGEAAFTKVMDIQKISGEDIIISHRLLKNTIPSDEYVLLTEQFASKCQSLNFHEFYKHVDNYEGVGKISTRVKYFEKVDSKQIRISLWSKFWHLMKLERYMLSRMFGKKGAIFKN